MSFDDLLLLRSPARQRRWSSCFEAVACRRDGSRIRGTAYRRGRYGAGDAYSYQFQADDNNIDQLAQEPEKSRNCTGILNRLAEILPAKDIDLLYLLHVAERSPAALAQDWHVHRATIARRQARINEILRKDPVLQQVIDCRR
jgi:hypothetical protein